MSIKSENFYIHFDTDEHFITGEQYIVTIKSLQVVSKTLIKSLSCEEDNNFEILVFPPCKGSLLTIFGIPITIYTIAKIIDSDMGKAFIRGLTGNEPSYYAEKLGVLFRDLLVGFFSKTKDELESLMSKYKEFDSAIKAKSDLYKMCYLSKNIKGLGFDNSDKFPIKKNNFLYYISENLIRKEDEISLYQELIIKKPVTIENDLKWAFIDKNTGKHFNAQMEDADFKQSFLAGNLPIKKSQNPDIIVAKVRIIKSVINGQNESSNYSIEKVYKFNEIPLENFPDDFELNKNLEEAGAQKQLNLFDDYF